MQSENGPFKTVYLKDDSDMVAMFIPRESFETYDKELEIGTIYDITFANIRIRKPLTSASRSGRIQLKSLTPLKTVTIKSLGQDGES